MSDTFVWPDPEQNSYEPFLWPGSPYSDRSGSIWGYELLFRHSGAAANAEISDADSATAQVIVDGVSLAPEQTSTNIAAS